MNPITREESLLDGQDLTPITRKEKFIKRIYDKTQEVPTPVTREEYFLKKAGEGTSPITIEQLSVTENGTYSETGKAYSPVIVEVPQTTVESLNITANGTYTAPSGKAYSPVTVNVEGFKKKSIANTPTDIASFDDGTANPMPSLEISIEPVQSGSGDPSPQNVRPISGWSGANIQRWKKNCVIGELEGCYINSNGRFTDDSNYSMQIAFVKKGVTYAITTDEALNRLVGGFFTSYPTKSSTTYSGERFIGENNIFIAPIDGYVAFRTSAGYSTPQCEVGNETTTYSPYQGSTLSIPFHDSSDNPITVYGGRLNVTSGELNVTMANIASYNGETINEPWISSMDVYSAGATPTTGAQVVYTLATPQTYQLTPQQVTTLLGQNNIFADCGQILEGEYFVTL